MSPPPAFTQPTMYARIKETKTTRTLYAERLAAWLEADTEGHTPPVSKHPTTTQIDCGDYFETRDDALRAHATQVDPDGFFFAVSAPMQRKVWPWEDYSLIESRVPTTEPENDLFAGLR